jgi:hypothetical protein
VTVGVTPSTNKNCTGPIGGPYSCTIALELRPGDYTASISTYDAVSCNKPRCTIPKNAKLLSSAKYLALKITAGDSNTVDFTLGGVVAKLTVSGLPSATIGTAFTSPQAFSVTGQDADGYTIVGPYDNPITLSNSDTTGATSIATRGPRHLTANTLFRSGDVATFVYTGGSIASATIGAAATGATSGSATFSPAFLLSARTGSIGTSVTETITGAGFISGETAVVAHGFLAYHVVVTSSTSLTAQLFTDPETPVTPQTLTITTGSNSNQSQTFAPSNANIDVVTLATDANPGNPAGTGAGVNGDLRYAILNAKAGDTIVFDATKMCGSLPCKLTLAGPLPPIAQNQTIDGGFFFTGNARILIDGGNATRAFWAQSGTIAIANLQIQNVKAQGGAGGGGAGGGAGLGAGLFVDAATVDVVNDYFLNNAAAGGIGGTGGGPGGGGGLGGAGSNGATVSQSAGSGGGGGGITGVGQPDNASGGGAGGAGFTATGGGQGFYECGGSGAAGGSGGYGGGGGGGGASCSPTVTDTSGSGGSGGLGAGGGGGGGSTTGRSGGNGGSGGLGGGGGGNGGIAGDTAGPGGPGGGGGAGSAAGGAGGALSASVGGGNGDGGGNGGGGAAAGPAIFVNTGTLNTINSGASAAVATAGPAGGGAATPGTANSVPVFNYGGTVNGTSVTAPNGGPVSNALGNNAPSLRRVRPNSTMPPAWHPGALSSAHGSNSRRRATS